MTQTLLFYHVPVQDYGSQEFEYDSKKRPSKTCIILKCKIPYHHVRNWMKFLTYKLAYVCCAIGSRVVWAFYSYHVFYASLRPSIANKGGSMKHVSKNQCIIETIAT